MAKIKEEITEYLFKVQIRRESEFEDEDVIAKPKQIVEHRGDVEGSDKPETVRREEEKVGRMSLALVEVVRNIKNVTEVKSGPIDFQPLLGNRCTRRQKAKSVIFLG